MTASIAVSQFRILCLEIRERSTNYFWLMQVLVLSRSVTEANQYW